MTIEFDADDLPGWNYGQLDVKNLYKNGLSLARFCPEYIPATGKKRDRSHRKFDPIWRAQNRAAALRYYRKNAETLKAKARASYAARKGKLRMQPVQDSSHKYQHSPVDPTTQASNSPAP